jgi:hypothetical protein
VYQQGFESRERTTTAIFGARRVSTNTRGELEARRKYVSASETVDHAVNPSFLEKTRMWQALLRDMQSEQTDRTSP